MLSNNEMEDIVKIKIVKSLEDPVFLFKRS